MANRSLRCGSGANDFTNPSTQISHSFYYRHQFCQLSMNDPYYVSITLRQEEPESSTCPRNAQKVTGTEKMRERLLVPLAALKSSNFASIN